MSLTGNGIDTQAPTMTVPIATSDDPRAKDMEIADQLEAARNIIYMIVKHVGGSLRITARDREQYFRELEGHQLIQYISPVNDDWVCECKKLIPIDQS